MLAPLLYIFFDVKIFVSNVEEAIAYTATYMVVNVMMQNYLYGSLRWPWVSELYEYCQGVFLLQGDRLRGACRRASRPSTSPPRARRSTTTICPNSPGRSSPSRACCSPARWRGRLALCLEPGVANLMLVVGLWNTFNLVIAGVALGAVSERKQPDRHPRLGIERKGALEVNGERVAVEIVERLGRRLRLRLVDEAPSIAARGANTAARLTIEPRRRSSRATQPAACRCAHARRDRRRRTLRLRVRRLMQPRNISCSPN